MVGTRYERCAALTAYTRKLAAQQGFVVPFVRMRKLTRARRPIGFCFCEICSQPPFARVPPGERHGIFRRALRWDRNATCDALLGAHISAKKTHKQTRPPGESSVRRRQAAGSGR